MRPILQSPTRVTPGIVHVAICARVSTLYQVGGRFRRPLTDAPQDDNSSSEYAGPMVILIPVPRCFVLLASLGFILLGTRGEAVDLFDGFADGWRAHWREEKFFTKATRYEVVAEEGRRVLHGVSQSAHAGLVRAIAVKSPARAHLNWRWKVLAPLTGNTRERERAGDDYTARVFVVFETSAFPLRTRAINYVWAAHEPVGAMFPSPYTKNVAMIVVRSGPVDAGRWVGESRDVLADYTRFFGTAPTEINAVAVLVDTDNTGRAAEAWFADLVLTATPSPSPAPR